MGRAKTLTLVQEAEACRRYLAGESIERVGRAFGVSDTPVRSALKAAGVQCRPRYSLLSEDARAAIARRYRAGESATALAAEHGIADVTVLRWLEGRGVGRRTNSQAQTKYTCRHDCFKEIDGEESAYWLGFLAADGCVKRSNDLAVALAERDRQHLERLAGFLGSNRPIPRETHNGRPMALLVVRSPQICADLTRRGVTPAKTFTLRWPALPEDLLAHFVRGYVDGDGGFYVRPSKHPSPHHLFAVTGHDAFIRDLQSFLMRRCALGLTRLSYRRPGKPIASLHYGGRLQVARIASLLYQDATVSLSRKRQPIEALLTL